MNEDDFGKKDLDLLRETEMFVVTLKRLLIKITIRAFTICIKGIVNVLMPFGRNDEGNEI